MQVVIAGGRGQIAMLLHPLLVANGHEARGLIRNPDQADAVELAGAKPVICDLESDVAVAPLLANADAVVFAAGAGPGSGAERKFSMDRDGAIKLMDAAKEAGVSRYVMISAMNAEQPRGEEVFQAYLKAKAKADAALRSSGPADAASPSCRYRAPRRIAAATESGCCSPCPSPSSLRAYCRHTTACANSPADS